MNYFGKNKSSAAAFASCAYRNFPLTVPRQLGSHRIWFRQFFVPSLFQKASDRVLAELHVAGFDLVSNVPCGRVFL
jgi:hypothetical protein